jgi:hypothetical protein
LSNAEQEAVRAAIAAQVDDYLATGGQINKIAVGQSKDADARFKMNRKDGRLYKVFKEKTPFNKDPVVPK